MKIKDVKFGCVRDVYDERDHVLTKVEPKEVPQIFDLRWKGVVPPVRDQGSLGSCTAFGSSGAAWSAMMSDDTYTTKPFHPSELFIYYNARDDKDNDTGASVRGAIKGLATKGIAPYEKWPYDPKTFRTPPANGIFESAKKFKAIKYARVEQTKESIVKVLASGYPIVFGHMCHANFMSIRKDGIVPLPEGQELGGHCEWIIGYNLPADMVGVQNSWGTKRGDAGYEYFHFDHILDPDVCWDFWTVYEISI